MLNFSSFKLYFEKWKTNPACLRTTKRTWSSSLSSKCDLFLPWNSWKKLSFSFVRSCLCPSVCPFVRNDSRWQWDSAEVFCTSYGPCTHSDTLLFWFRANHCLFLLLRGATLAEKQQLPVYNFLRNKYFLQRWIYLKKGVLISVSVNSEFHICS
jgi:hypothetical protein